MRRRYFADLLFVSKAVYLNPAPSFEYFSGVFKISHDARQLLA